MHPTYLTHSPSIYLLCQISCALETDPEYMCIYIYSFKVIYIYVYGRSLISCGIVRVSSIETPFRTM